MKTKAIILAAGFGTRMKEYTKDLPKPMLPFNGKPMIEYTIRQLAAHGVTEIAMNLHHHADKISGYFETGENFGVKLTYTYEKTPSGTAGGVKALSDFCKDTENIIVIYGDIITDLNYTDFILTHNNHKQMATICVHKRMKSNSIINFNEHMKITTFIERPSEEILEKYAIEPWVNSAIYCFKPKILDLILPNTLQDFPKDVFPQLITSNELYAYKLNASRYAIDSEEMYQKAQQNLTKFNFSF